MKGERAENTLEKSNIHTFCFLEASKIATAII